LLLLGLVLTGCPTEDTGGNSKNSSKDDDDDDSSSTTNPFVGTWEGGDYTLTVTDSAWTLKYDGENLTKGTYTYEGEKVDLQVTPVVVEDG
jgi:hypothetical protein